jgi:paraquat-inducible protein A
LRQRDDHQLPIAWAMVITGYTLMIPANLYPIMIVGELGVLIPATIISGIIELFQRGMVFIGIIVFVASIVVPIFKLVGLTWILGSIQFGWNRHLVTKTKLFHIIEGIGRWSMLDIFVIGLLGSLIQLGIAGNVSPGPGAWFFASVVVITMIAARFVDIRMLWDHAKGMPSHEIR